MTFVEPFIGRSIGEYIDLLGYQAAASGGPSDAIRAGARDKRALRPASASLKARTGVGVRADGKVIFAISQGEVSFDAFRPRKVLHETRACLRRTVMGPARPPNGRR